MSAFDFAPAIPLLPFASFVLVLIVGYYAPSFLPKGGAIPGILATGGALLLSLWLLIPVTNGVYYNEPLYTWVLGKRLVSISGF